MERPVIEAQHLTKKYGPTLAVDDLSFTLQPGSVTGFLGPNGAGKTTTMRMIVGLDNPTGGRVTVGGVPYRELKDPLRQVGVLLDAKAMHGGRTAKAHLLCLAASNGIPLSRVDEVLNIVGLQSVAGRRAGGFSLGMGQRLGIAAALLGDPGILIFDEPINGLDPEGIVWVRTMVRGLAAEGRTVMISSHLMTEMAQTADRLLVIGRGRLMSDSTVDEFVARSAHRSVLVRSPQADQLAQALGEIGAEATVSPDGSLDIKGVDAPQVGDLAAKYGLALHELTPKRASLEEAFMELTHDSVEYGTDRGAPPPGGPGNGTWGGPPPPGQPQPGQPQPANDGLPGWVSR